MEGELEVQTGLRQAERDAADFSAIIRVMEFGTKGYAGRDRAGKCDKGTNDQGPIMWNCPRCKDMLPESFTVCWQCGTGRSGEKDPVFAIVPREPKPLDEEDFDSQARLQCSLKCLLLFLAAIVVLWGLSYEIPLPEEVATSLSVVIAANLFGALVALLITYVLRIPNDGSVRWDDSKRIW